MKTVAIDGQALQSGSRLGGIGRYSEQLIYALALAAPEVNFVVLLNDRLRDGLVEALRHCSVMPANVNVMVASFPDFDNFCDDPNDVRRTLAEVCKYAVVDSLAPDLYLNCSVIEGYAERVVGDGYLLDQPKTWARCAVLYDVIPLANPELYLTDDRLRKHYFLQLERLRSFDHLLAISEYSREQFAEKVDYPLDQITNISGGIDHVMPDGSSSNLGSASSALDVKGLTRDFVLFVGSFDVRKNQKGLIRGFARLPPQLRRKHQLVIVGNGWRGIYDSLREVAASEGMGAGEIIFAGKVSDATLQSLYNSCKLFVFPSFSEGLGLPVLEAMRAGAPTICSSTSCMPEIMGCDDFLFDPYDANAISAAMERGLADDAFRRALSVHCAGRWQSFTWRATAELVLAAAAGFVIPPDAVPGESTCDGDIVESLTDHARFIAEASPRVGIRYDSSLSLAKNVGALQRLRQGSAPLVAVVSSWQQKCGIASYAENLMCEWHQEEFVVFAPLSPADELLHAHKGASVSRCWTRGTQDGLALLRDHILCSGAGAVLLHFNYGFFAVSSLGDLIDTLTNYGVETSIVFHATVDPIEWNPDQRLSLIENSLAKCRALYVHAPADIERLSKLELLNIKLLPHGIDVSRDALEIDPDLDTAGRDRRENQIFRVGAFGYCLPHKGFTTLLKSFAKVRDEYPGAELVLLTSEYPADASRKEIQALTSLIEAHELEEVVQLNTRYLEMETLLKRLAACDLIIFPYNNTSESSSAAVRTALAAMVPVAVTPLEIFDDVGESTLRLRGFSANEIAADILDIAKKYSQDPQAFGNEQKKIRAFLKKSAFFEVSSRLRRTMLRSEV